VQADVEQDARERTVAKLTMDMVSFIEIQTAIEDKSVVSSKDELLTMPHVHLDGEKGCANDAGMPHPSLVPTHLHIGRSTHVHLASRWRDCSCDVHLCSLHSACTQLSQSKMQLHTQQL
jgi:hypothetical protein